ncbi:PREDICTED: uncharacterized protein LOC105568974 [Vollenhovia emeryi]|uniref:uncharacterized protein LOC105568974 n=1 Tax=Vollenhovia emeryi TaxID=411798 RepID=UPI0005F3E7BA|nr:PREDICTED: uncharacterized protein LOC105568974 [Vollenhovia emeryi]
MKVYIEGKLTTAQQIPESDVVLGNNCVAFMFDEIRYELDGVEIDRTRNVGITSTLQNYVSASVDKMATLKNAGWDVAFNGKGDFNFCVPLNMLLGFCEDYKRVIQWRMPHVLLNEVNKLSILRTLESGRYLNMGFRSWDLHEFPLLQQTTKHSWAIKTATQLEKPRYVIFVLQTGRKNIMSENACKFSHCKLSNSYFGNDDLAPGLTVYKFLEYGPFVIIDCSRQNESVKSATVEVRLEFECKENVPTNTTAYCLIIHDRVVQYNPLPNVVRKIT